MWWSTQIIACVLITVVNVGFRYYGFSFWPIFVGVLVCIPVEICFAKSYSIAPSFFQAWFFGTILLTVFGFVISLLVFDGVVSVRHYFGLVLATVGAYLLVLK